MNMSNHERGDDITSLYVVQKSWFWKDLEFFFKLVHNGIDHTRNQKLFL